jgi:hypothetical protein
MYYACINHHLLAPPLGQADQASDYHGLEPRLLPYCRVATIVGSRAPYTSSSLCRQETCCRLLKSKLCWSLYTSRDNSDGTRTRKTALQSTRTTINWWSPLQSKRARRINLPRDPNAQTP